MTVELTAAEKSALSLAISRIEGMLFLPVWKESATKGFVSTDQWYEFLDTGRALNNARIARIRVHALDPEKLSDEDRAILIEALSQEENSQVREINSRGDEMFRRLHNTLNEPSYDSWDIYDQRARNVSMNYSDLRGKLGLPKQEDR